MAFFPKLSSHQVVLRPVRSALQPSADHDFVRGMLTRKLTGTDPTAPEVTELLSRVPYLDDAHWADVRVALKDGGISLKKMGSAPAKAMVQYLGGDLGTSNGVQTALMDNSTAIWKNRGNNEALKAARDELFTLRSAFHVGAAPRPKPLSPGEATLKTLVTKRNAGSALSVGEGVAAGQTLRRRDVTALTRRHAHQEMLAADGRKLSRLRAAKPEDTLDLLYPRERVVKGLEALEAQPPNLATAPAMAAHAELLALHDTGHYTFGQDLRVVLATGPAGNMGVAGGSLLVGLDRTAKNMETNTFSYRPFLQGQGNVLSGLGGYVAHPEQAGFIRGVGTGVVNMLHDPISGDMVEIPLIPGLAKVGASDQGMLELNLMLPLPAMHLPLPFGSHDLPLAFPFFGLRVRAAVQEPRLEPIARGVGKLRDAVARKLKSPRSDPLPQEFRRPASDRPRHPDWLSSGMYLR